MNVPHYLAAAVYYVAVGMLSAYNTQKALRQK
jgi:hypothetical protein